MLRKKNSLDDEKKGAQQPTLHERSESEDEFDVEIPDGYVCPLSGIIMEDPVTAADGHTYNRPAITKWLRNNNQTSPTTGDKLKHTELIPNYALKKAIEYFLSIRLAIQLQGPTPIDTATQLPLELKPTSHGTAPQQNSILLVLPKPEEKRVDPMIARLSQHRQLQTAAQRGDLEKIDLLLKAGTDPDRGLIHGNTPIFAATQQPDTRIFKRLLEAKANIHVKNSHGYTLSEYIGLFCPWSRIQKNELLTLLAKKWATLAAPLQASCLKEITTLNKILAQDKSSVIETKDGKRNTVFHYAATNGHNKVLKLLNKAFSEQLLLKNEDGLTPLLFAAIAGHKKTLKWLTAQGVPLTERSAEGNTALIWAAGYGRLEAAQWLVKHGASIQERSNEGNSALLLAAYQGQLTMVQWLLGQGASPTETNQAGCTALLMAACNGQLLTVQWLLEYGGASIAERSQNGSTALLWAAYYGHVETVQWLRGHGALLAERSHNNNTALIWAAYNNQLETAQWLLDDGAPLAEKNNNGNTALQCATPNGHIHMIALLLKNGASLTEKNSNGGTPLLTATYNGQLETVQWLLNHGASIKEKSNNGNTALLWAVSRNHLDLVQWLLEEGGATLSEQNNKKETAFDLATTDKMNELLHKHLLHSKLRAVEEKTTGTGTRLSGMRGRVFPPTHSSPSHRSHSVPGKSIVLESKSSAFKNE